MKNPAILNVKVNTTFGKVRKLKKMIYLIIDRINAHNSDSHRWTELKRRLMDPPTAALLPLAVCRLPRHQTPQISWAQTRKMVSHLFVKGDKLIHGFVWNKVTNGDKMKFGLLYILVVSYRGLSYCVFQNFCLS